MGDGGRKLFATLMLSQLKMVSFGRPWNRSFNTKLNGQTAHVPPIWKSLSNPGVAADLLEMPLAGIQRGCFFCASFAA